ncbi:hypothetical protein [Curtobacterium sp. MCBA15_001]|uniref:hypothetical protein n=1 Tax=Curtobacterium sp. MCBA15_001 TaxID=1898731 RepID=UPI0008DC5CF9|nr:hypothetical protein [Curtobacterium sp. MCBA15_001]OIH96418.1 hypothetical protein BIU90_17305 [Curtobacterium sp. MCBA15_001]
MSDVPPVPPESPGPSGPPPQGPAPTAAPREPDAFGRLPRSIGGRDWLAASIAGVGAWVAAYVVAGIALLLTVGLVAVGGSGDASFGGASLPDDGLGGTSGAPDVQSLLSGLSVLLGAPAQLVALADFGRLHVSGSIALLGVSGAASVGVVPALVLLAQVVLAVVLTRRIRSRVLGLPQVLVTSALTGVVLTACTTVAGLALAIRFPASAGIAISAVHAVGVGSIVGAFVVGALSALMARPALLVNGRVFVARALGTARVAVLHVGTLTVLVAVVLVLVALVAQPAWGAALPIVIGNLALALVALGFLGSIGSSGLGGGAQSASVFGGTTGWIWLVVLVVLVTAVLAGLLLAVRRNDRVRATLDWVVTPAVWLVAGVVVFALGTAVVSYSATGASAVSGSGSVGITPWTPIVFALWGAAVEVVARYLAPVLLPLVGGRLVLLGSKVVGADPRPVVAPTWSGAPVDGPAADVVGSQPPVGAGDAQPPVGWVGSQQPVGASDAQAPVVAHQPFVGQGAASAEPMSPRARKVLVRSMVAGGVVVVVVVAGAVTAGVLRSNVWGPAPTVRSYVDAIARGDATAAARMSEVPGDATMLDTAVLTSAKDRPADIRVGRVRTSGDTATATVSYTQDGRNRSGSVELRRTGTSWLVRDEWRVTTPLATRVSVGASSVLEGAPVTIAGKRVGKIENGSFASLAYPGTYRVQVGGSKYFVGGTKTVSAGSAASSAYVDFEPQATEQLTTDAKQWVDDLITTCAAKTDVDALDGCPWYGPYDAEGPVTYAVKTMPELEVEATGSGTVQVTSTSDGVIGYDYTSFFGDSGHAEDRFDVSEYLKVQDGKLVSAF